MYGDFPHSMSQLTVRTDIPVPSHKTLGEAWTSTPNLHITLGLANTSLIIPGSSYAPHSFPVCYTTARRQHSNQPEGHTLNDRQAQTHKPKRKRSVTFWTLNDLDAVCMSITPILTRPMPTGVLNGFSRHVSCSTGPKQNPCFSSTFHNKVMKNWSHVGATEQHRWRHGCYPQHHIWFL